MMNNSKAVLLTTVAGLALLLPLAGRLTAAQGPTSPGRGTAGLSAVKTTPPAGPDQAARAPGEGEAFSPSPSLPFTLPSRQGANGQNVELVGQIGGPTYAVAVRGSYAYAGVGPRLVVLDVSDPSQPTLVEQTGVLPDVVEGMAVAAGDLQGHPYAYVADREGGLRVIDVADPAAPSEVGSYDTSGTALGVAVAAGGPQGHHYAHIADGTGGLVILRFLGKLTPTPTPTLTNTPERRQGFLPVVLRSIRAVPTPIPYFEGPWEVEPNNSYQEANGPLRSGRDYYGYPDDRKDYFSIYLPGEGQITIDLTNHTGQGVQLQLFYQSAEEGNRVGYAPTAPYHIEYSGPAGWYYVYIYTASGYNSYTPYTLRTTTPARLAEMVYVPAGEFTMGSDEGYSDERPVHTVYLDAYWMDMYEVTNGQFAEFLNERGNQSEGGAPWLDAGVSYVRIHQHGGEWRADSGYGDHPVIEVSWYGARAYCQWAGKGLPTEAEWEKGARGTDGRTYPWGNSAPDCNKAQYAPCSGETVPVGSKPAGASPYGALDMAGNVWEWVADWYASDYYSQSPYRNPPGPSSGSGRALRGGSWLNSGGNVRAAYRFYGLNPALTNYYVGFRCARDAP